jgi:hypothetical protein
MYVPFVSCDTVSLEKRAQILWDTPSLVYH